MKRAFVALAMIFAVFIGLSVAPNGGTAQAAYGTSVNNSGYSTISTLVCGVNSNYVDAGCVTVQPGGTITAVRGWTPNAIAVGPYYTSLYRVIKLNGYTTGWVGIEGGRNGRWIDVGALRDMWGNDIQVQAIIDGPFY